MIIAISIFFLKISLRQNWYDIGLSSNTHMCKDSLQPGHKADLVISHYTVKADLVISHYTVNIPVLDFDTASKCDCQPCI